MYIIIKILYKNNFKVIEPIKNAENLAGLPLPVFKRMA
jgi:hypothetical protein